mmetsp:Transcript_98808/g.235530  ORF Transcript_98808/g.235530 Transcript_98808/m.235530 type:complete len:85 (-) Transcript_98808:750-1004(-)
MQTPSASLAQAADAGNCMNFHLAVTDPDPITEDPMVSNRLLDNSCTCQWWCRLSNRARGRSGHRWIRSSTDSPLRPGRLGLLSM